ncbi:DNA/RNA non-specific endonuclease [Hymenobacter sp. BT18]|uniref:DNA/RNA non-specific endonuclease n=1 Tax=Hymenobacter sp. BT18 TaxID=2835648 RepID=UPI00143ED24B|nr:DNA/RNA non-specific endonuclease [Hymenobacter sp. BT18]QIX63093.1 DNA/RNA non-specific endonuclease [Hymenobacter sp. BT18]
MTYRAQTVASCWLAASLLLTGCIKEPYDPAPTPPGGTAIDDDNMMTMGNPSGATADVGQPTNYLLVKPQYALSYHRDRGIPNWVSWRIAASWLGSADRQDDFRADNTLPAGWYQVQGSSYSGSGFDRGHNCPSADRTSSVADNSATFLMTNMIPQAPNNNQQTWADLENYCRTLVRAGNELYVIMGSYGKGGTGSNGLVTTLDNGRVTVPKRVWKVIVVLPVGNNDAARVSASTRLIAVDTPNDNGLSRAWGQYRTSVDAIEAATGLDLLSAVPPAAQAAVEAKVDAGPVN